MAIEKRPLDSLEIIGGVLCLNFINTINSRHTLEYDYLMTCSDVIGWANRVGVLSTTQMNRLQERAEEETESAEKALQDAKMLRELLYRLFSNIAQHAEPPGKNLEVFVQLLGEAVSNSHFVKQGDCYQMNWEADQTYEAMLWPIIHSAGQLLMSEELMQVKECPGCGWLFLDTSKNQSRRWCSMNSCGVSDKMRRYYERLQKKAGGGHD